MIFILINASCIYNWSIQNFKVNYNDFIEVLWNYRKHLKDWLLLKKKKQLSSRILKNEKKRISIIKKNYKKKFNQTK